MPTTNCETVAIIVNYFLAADVARAAESIFAEDTDTEVWVVDNSQDSDEAEHLQAALDGRCRILINERNLGFGAACNQVYEQTRSKYLFLLNPDAWCLPGALRALIACLEQRPRAGAAGPRSLADDNETLLPPLWIPPWWQTLIYQRFGRLACLPIWLQSLWFRRRALALWQTETIAPQEGIVGAHMLLRRSAVDQAGGLFDPKFFLYYEDTDLCSRLRRRGWQSYLVPQAVIIHAFSSTVPDRTGWKGDISRNSEAYFMQKRYGANRRQVMWSRLNRYLDGGERQPVVESLINGDLPPVVPVPPKWQDGWLLEIGANPYLLPAAGLLGQGLAAQLTPEFWQRLQPAAYYCRLGPSRPAWLRPAIFHFRKLPQAAFWK